MSNFLSIALATETLRQMLDTAVKADVSGAQATAVRPAGSTPGAAGNTPALGVNVFLYQVTPNAAYRNRDLPTRGSDGGSILQRPRAAIDLHYVISCYGDDGQLEPQRLLGTVVRTLHQHAVLTRAQIGSAKSAFAFFKDSNLDTDIELVKLSPTTLTFEDLSKMWSILFQTPYALSITYMASLLLLEGTETPREALPATRRNLVTVPFMQPVVDRVLWAASPGDTPKDDTLLIAGDTLTLVGRHLRGDVTRVRFGDGDAPADTVTDTRVTVKLAEPPFPAQSLRAGPQAVQVIQDIAFGTPGVPHRGPQSPVVAAVLSPTISAPAATSTTVSVTVVPTVGKLQRVELLLNQLGGPAAYHFQIAPDADTSSLSFPISGVPTGDYLIRIRVDGAQSPLDVDASDNLVGTPKVHVP
jgi:hypothetical protein